MRARIFTIEQLRKGGPYIGPKGGLWADPSHTVAWDPKQHGKITPSNCPSCKGLGHIVRQQKRLDGSGHDVSSGFCRTCNKDGKHAFDPKKAHALGLPTPAEHQKKEEPAAPKKQEQLSLLSYRAPAQQEKLFRAMPPADLVKNLPTKEKLTVHGLVVHIENPKGSVRRWYDPVKKQQGETVMVHPYGYIHGTKGADGEDVDVFVGPNPASKLVVIVNQRRTKDYRRFDEHKVLLGFNSAKEARDAYLKNYDTKGPKLMGSVRVWTIERFKRWLETGATDEPAQKSLTL